MSWFVDATMDSWFHFQLTNDALSVLEVVSTCSFWGPEKVLFLAPMFCGRSPDVWLHGYMKSLNPVFPLNSFRGPISSCIMLGNFHQGFVQPTSHSTTVRHQQNIAINKKAGGKAKVCIPEKSHGIHKKLVNFAKFVGRLHSSFPIKLFQNHLVTCKFLTLNRKEPP